MTNVALRTLLSFFLAVALVFVSSTPTPVSAQTASESGMIESETPAPPSVFINPSDNAQIQSLQALYAQQIEAYRTAERQHELAISQHEKLQSLSSLEAAVQATQTVMQRRSDVLITYLDLLYAHLQDTFGLDLAQKDAQSKRLEETISLLREHRESLSAADNRESLLAVPEEFSPLFARVKIDAERTRSLIALGRMQVIYDKAQIVQRDILQLQNTYEVSALKQAERDRAFAEIDRQFELANVSLKSVRDDLGVAEVGGSYRSVSGELVMISSGLQKILSYLDEALRL